MSHPAPEGTILRLFEVQVKPGAAAELLEKFASASADVVQHEPGNQGYFFGPGVAADEGWVVFASLWESLDAVKARFGPDWQSSFLPEGYEALIETCRVRHVQVGAGWHAAVPPMRR